MDLVKLNNEQLQSHLEYMYLQHNARLMRLSESNISVDDKIILKEVEAGAAKEYEVLLNELYRRKGVGLVAIPGRFEKP